MQDIRKERRALYSNSDISIEVVDGSLNPSAVTRELLEEFYASCYLPSQQFWGNVHPGGKPTLVSEFWSHLGMHFQENLLFVLARCRRPTVENEEESSEDGSSEENEEEEATEEAATAAAKPGRIIGGSLSVVQSRRICGRYWGPSEILPGHPFLHFECCYYALVEHAIKHGYERVEPGNGGMSIYDAQRRRGFEPRCTPSFHYFPDPPLHKLVESLVARTDAGRPAWTRPERSAYRIISDETSASREGDARKDKVVMRSASEHPFSLS